MPTDTIARLIHVQFTADGTPGELLINLDNWAAMCAAPDLLAALKQFVADHEVSGHYCEGLNAAYTQAITAIARAEGR